MGGLSPGRAAFLVGVLVLASFTYVLGVLQFSPLLTAMAAEFEVSESAVGQLSTIGGLVGTAMALLAAPWMSRFSRRAWIVGEVLVVVVGVILTATAPSFAVLIAGRVVMSVGGGALMANCFTAASELFPDARQRTRAVAFVVSGTTLAILAGLPIVALLNDAFGWRWAAAGVLVPWAVVLLGMLGLPDNRARSSASGGPVVKASGFRAVIAHRPTLWLMVVMIVLMMAYIGWITYYGAYVENEFGVSAQRLGTLFLVGGLCELASNMLAPSLIQRFSAFSVSMVGILLAVVALLGSGVVFTTPASLFVSIALIHVSTSVVYLGSNTLLLDAQPEQRGPVMAIASAASGFGGSGGALLAGAILSVSGNYDLAYQGLGVMMLLAVVALVLSRREPDV
jgi:predicted MFS family arabinose efflux permease